MNIKDNFVKPDNPVLIKIAPEIPVDKITSAETKKLIEKMLKAAFGEQTDNTKPLLVGLAAPQIGISKRIILVDLKAHGKGDVGDLRVYINPEVIWRSEEISEWYEGCYSTSHVCGIVSRPNKIKIKAYTKDGQEIEEEHEGYTARIFQHEIDHLNGQEFVTHITDDQKLHWVEDDQFPQYRNNEGWRTWPIKCPREKWEKIKGIR
jgi:peptide deformylase